jgi:hypothetical protein
MLSLSIRTDRGRVDRKSTSKCHGSTDPTLAYHEFGTSKMPPRPVLGLAVVNSREKIEKLFGRAIVEGILGGEVMPDGGYFGGDIG